MRFPTMWYVRPTKAQTSRAYAQSGQSLCKSLEYSMSVNLLTKQHLKFLSLKVGCTGSSESTLVKMTFCHIVGNRMLRLITCISKAVLKCEVYISIILTTFRNFWSPWNYAKSLQSKLYLLRSYCLLELVLFFSKKPFRSCLHPGISLIDGNI